MRTVEEILKEARSRGLALSNLFELSDSLGCTTQPSKPLNQWQANFRHATGWYDFGRGGSPSEALEDAIGRCKGAKGSENRPIPKVIKPAIDIPTLDDLL